MNELVNVNVRIKRWKALSDSIPSHLRRKRTLGPSPTGGSSPIQRNSVPQNATRRIKPSNNILDTNDNNKCEEDPFDCTELIVPPTYELVQHVLKEHVEEWRELDSRLIITEQPIRRVGTGRFQKAAATDSTGKESNEETNVGVATIDGTAAVAIGTEVINTTEKDADHSTVPASPSIENNEDNQTNNENEKRINATENPATLNTSTENSRTPTTETSKPSSIENPAPTNNWNWVWNRDRVKLPDFFDYTCKGDPPQPPPSPPQNSNENDRDQQKYNLRRKVISLEDPTKHLDYECELWNIFKEVPLATDIEKEAVEGHACVETMKIRNQIEEGMKNYSRMDAHLLSRLRKRERHHWPRVCVPPISRSKRRKGQRQEVGWSGLGDICGATIRVECWRRQLKRGSGCDPNRCEVELLESQTLLDLHDVLVTCSQDDLFTYGSKQERMYENETKEGDEQASSRNVDAPIEYNGYFFIEDTFYTHGDVDYVTPIIDWLNEEVSCDAKKGTKKEKNQGKKRKKDPSVIRSRREYLGIKTDVELKIVPMKETKLGDLSFRLATRYVHVFNGDCESAIFFSDVCMRMSNENVLESQYPLIHDIFTTTTCVATVQESMYCQACEKGSAVVMTLNDEMADGGPTLFCALCHAKLHYSKDGSRLLYNNFEVIPLTVLQNLRDLSVGNDRTDALF